MTPYGGKPAYRTRGISGIAPWSRAVMAALVYWCVLSTVLVSANLAKADIEFYPDYPRPVREDLRFLENDRTRAPTGEMASRAPNSRPAPQVGAGSANGAIESVAPPSIDIDESTQRQQTFNVDPLAFVQRPDLGGRIYREKVEQLNEMRRREEEEEARRQQMHEEELLEKMLADQQATYFNQYRREFKNEPWMQVRHRANYPENAVEKPAQNLPAHSNPAPLYYADPRLKNIFFPPSNHRQSVDAPSLRDLTALADAELPDEDLSMDGSVDSPDASGDVQHVLQYYGGAVPAGAGGAGTRAAGTVPQNAPLPPPRVPVFPAPAAASPAPPATAPPAPPPRSKSRSQLYNPNTIQMEDGTVVKKVLRMPDHWFLGMPDVYKLAIVIGCSVMGAAVVIGGLIWQYRLHRRAKAAADVDYPAYGVTGPSRDLSPSGDRRLAQSAEIYHYQHQKQQILSMEGGNQPASRGSMSEAESEDENEEGDYTVYECPGLAPPGEMEVKNPMFDDDPSTATPATPASPGSTTVDQTEAKSLSTSKGSPSSK